MFPSGPILHILSENEMKTRDVLGLGCATIDELLFVEAYPAPDGKVPVRDAQTQGRRFDGDGVGGGGAFGRDLRLRRDARF